MIDQLLKRIAGLEGCIVHPPQGQPKANHSLPEDLQSFYAICGGALLFKESMCPVQISSPEEFIPSNMKVLGALAGDDPSDNWYVVAKSGEEQLVSIDLNQGKVGRCYDSFWDRHAVVGSCPVIALSFSEFLRQTIEARGKGLYWLSSAFEPLGDAYD